MTAAINPISIICNNALSVFFSFSAFWRKYISYHFHLALKSVRAWRLFNSFCINCILIQYNAFYPREKTAANVKLKLRAALPDAGSVVDKESEMAVYECDGFNHVQTPANGRCFTVINRRGALGG